jgi:hypothetical protein
MDDDKQKPLPKLTSQGLTRIAESLGRIASDLDSEKRTRADSNRLMLDELKGLRTDMQKAFHGDNENPGIFIRLDRIERNSFDDIAKKFEAHELIDQKREEKFNQALLDLGGNISSLKLEDIETRAYVKGVIKTATWVLGGVITISGLIIAVVELAVNIWHK